MWSYASGHLMTVGQIFTHLFSLHQLSYTLHRVPLQLSVV